MGESRGVEPRGNRACARRARRRSLRPPLPRVLLSAVQSRVAQAKRDGAAPRSKKLTATLAELARKAVPQLAHPRQRAGRGGGSERRYSGPVHPPGAVTGRRPPLARQGTVSRMRSAGWDALTVGSFKSGG